MRKKIDQKQIKNQEQEKLLLEILTQDSRTPFMQIAKQLKVSEGTIRNKIHTLQKRGTIKKFTIEQGSTASVIFIITVKTGISTRDVAAKIREFKKMTNIFEVAGKADIICFAKTSGLNETNEIVDRIREITGVATTETIPILKEVE